MKTTFTTLFLLLISYVGFCQTYPVDTLYKTGPLSNRINVVILGDGFTKEELPKFTAEARKFADFFLSYEPYNRYKDYFNFFSIPTPSKESGVTNPGTAPDAYTDQPVGKKNTFYSGTFGSSIHRLVTINYAVALNVLASNLPEYDLTVVLINTTFYGGSGGSVAVHTLNEQANLIGVHEIGHTFSQLNDEYWAGSGYGWEAPNMTMDGNPATIKWKNWLNSNGIGIYKHQGDGDAASWHKPTQGTCLMEFLNQQFCAVCREATTEKILSLVMPVEKLEPDAEGTIMLDGPKTFKLHLINPVPNTVQVDWVLDGKAVTGGSGEITLSPDDINGFGVLSATVFDSTSMSRKSNIRDVRSWKFEWNLQSNSPQVFKIRASADSICLGREATLTASGCPGTISWATGEIGKSITIKPNATTSYEASCKVDGQATSKISKTITVLPLPTATASNTGPYFEGATITLTASGGTEYAWSGPRGFTANTQSASIPQAFKGSSGIYEVNVTDVNGCMAKAMTEVKVDPILAVGNRQEEWVQVSPNPAKDYVKVTTKLPGESQIVIFNQAGKKLASRIFTRQTELKLNAGSGLFIYKFSNGSKQMSGKLIVE
ncbi:M64 family metallopeptidase [Dyadobacter pollutisoli]|uniref:M64 family metallo-endopeptidase n=1 Tax=Dyadobacter pollutisoli TaxID=2910158 RepID=A0A9E8SM56_9BACT|nr:M64 family metallopeptidase [Dyadobacter pollutisoli]WAC14385.1 M64 family metallo-endopeptidase [Dyadobacter pollutisoli]